MSTCKMVGRGDTGMSTDPRTLWVWMIRRIVERCTTKLKEEDQTSSLTGLSQFPKPNRRKKRERGFLRLCGTHLQTHSPNWLAGRNLGQWLPIWHRFQCWQVECMFLLCGSKKRRSSMSWKNRRLVADEPVEFEKWLAEIQDPRKITGRSF